MTPKLQGRTKTVTRLRCVHRFNMCGDTSVSDPATSNEQTYKDSIMLSYGSWGLVRIQDFGKQSNTDLETEPPFVPLSNPSIQKTIS